MNGDSNTEDELTAKDDDIARESEGSMNKLDCGLSRSTLSMGIERGMKGTEVVVVVGLFKDGEKVECDSDIDEAS